MDVLSEWIADGTLAPGDLEAFNLGEIDLKELSARRHRVELDES